MLLNIKFHFPYDSISFEKVPDGIWAQWKGRIIAGAIFEAHVGDTEVQFRDKDKTYVINPVLLTYIEVSHYKEFGF